MLNWQKILINPSLSILDALEIIDRGTLRLGLVVDEERRLLGVVTDGDVRRGLLRKIGLDAPVVRVMSSQPVVARIDESREGILARMRAQDLYHIPVVDAQGRVVRLETLQELSQPGRRENWVVIMAGGLGSRLGSLTEHCPKPLLTIGSRPILEIIIEGFLAFGFHRFFLSVNYKKKMIQDHFGDGSRWGAEIGYLEEEGRMGTAGSLALLPRVGTLPADPFFVINGDLLTKIDFARLLDYHQEHAVQATLCVRRIEETIPYGVVKLDRKRPSLLSEIQEKPVVSNFINAGIYLLSPEVLSLITPGSPLDMPELLTRLLKQGQSVAAFPFLEYWLDIGRLTDWQQACRDYEEIFA